MASPSRVLLDTRILPVFATKLRVDAAKKTSELLQANHERHHIFFNHTGFHNHIVHHLLTIYALGASPEEIQTAYDNNATYQRPPVKASLKDVANLEDSEAWEKCLGIENNYQDFVDFFRKEIEKSSMGDVVNKYLFAGVNRADDMLVRLHAGLVHPLIHLGFGIEFQQPTIVAEALAQTAIHDNRVGRVLLPAEEAAKQSGRRKMDRSIASLADEVSVNHKLKREHDETIRLLSQVVVGDGEIEERKAEMMNAALYFVASAVPSKKKAKAKIDFFLLHCVTSSVFFPALLDASSPLSTEAKQRLLEYKIRMDIGMYASCGAPELDLEEVRKCTAKHPGGWDGIFERVRRYPDDGHASKFIRAVAAVEQQCKKYESDEERFRIRGNDYLTIGHMVMDSIEGLEDESSTEPRWTRPDDPVSLL